MRETRNHEHFLMIGNTSPAITILLCLQLKIAQTLEGNNSWLDQSRDKTSNDLTADGLVKYQTTLKITWPQQEPRNNIFLKGLIDYQIFT